jgi:hypothetical protein
VVLFTGDPVSDRHVGDRLPHFDDTTSNLMTEDKRQGDLGQPCTIGDVVSADSDSLDLDQNLGAARRRSVDRTDR